MDAGTTTITAALALAGLQIGLFAWLRSDIGALSGRMVTVERRVAGLESGVALLKNDIGGLSERMVAVERRVAGLENDIGGLSERMVAVEHRVAGLESEIALLKNDIGALSGRMVAVERGVAGVESELAFVRGQLSLCLPDPTRSRTSAGIDADR